MEEAQLLRCKLPTIIPTVLIEGQVSSTCEISALTLHVGALSRLKTLFMDDHKQNETNEDAQ